MGFFSELDITLNSGCKPSVKETAYMEHDAEAKHRWEQSAKLKDHWDKEEAHYAAVHTQSEHLPIVDQSEDAYDLAVQSCHTFQHQGSCNGCLADACPADAYIPF